MHPKFCNVVLGMLVLITPTWANEPVMVLSLKDAILLSLRYSPIVKSAEVQRVVDKFNLAVAKNQFEYQYALTGLANQTNSVVGGAPLAINGNYNLVPTVSRLTPYGTQFNVSMANPITVNKSPGINTSYYNPAVTMQVTQPILQGSGREIVQSNLAQSYNTEKITEMAYASTMMTQITQVTVDYWSVVSAEKSLTVARDSLKALQKIVVDNTVRIQLGFLAPSENVQAKAAVAAQQLQVTSAEYTVVQTKLALLQDIGMSPNTKFAVREKLSVEDYSYPRGEEAKVIMFARNPTYQSALLTVTNSKIALLQAEDKQRWLLNFSGTVVQGGGTGGDGNDGLASISNGLNRSRNVGLVLNVPIDNLPTQQLLVAAKVNYTQQQLALRDLALSLESTLITSLENLRVLHEQVKLARNSEQLAYQSYKDALTKVNFGQSSMFEVTSLQTSYVDASLTTITTEISYVDAIANYRNLLGIPLDVWNIKLAY